MNKAHLLAYLTGALCSQIPKARNDLERAHGGVADDLALLDVVAGTSGLTLLRLWSNPPCIVVPRQIASRPGFAAARDRAESGGWPVITRTSGGTAVVHRPGVLNISLAYTESDMAIDINRGYARLATLIGNALAPLKIDIDMGPAPGSFCDGRHNIRWRGRKLAGTAAAVKRRDRLTAHLVHASLTAWGDVAEDVTIIQNFEADCGIDTIYDARAHVTLDEILKTQAIAA